MEEQNLGFVAGIDHSGFDKDAKHIQDSVEQVAKKVEQSGLSVDEFARHMQGVIASFDKLTQAVDKNTKAQEQSAQAGKKAADVEKQGADKATEAIVRTDSAAKELGGSLRKAGDEGSAGFDKLAKYAAGFFTLQKAAEFGKKIFEVRGEIQSLQTSFETLVGNKQQAEDLFNSIREFATKTPMQLKDLAGAAQTMMSFNIPVEQIMENLKALGDVSMGDAQKFQSLSLAFSQMSATGKLMGQDLLQMINAGFNPLATISEKTGKSISELKDEMSKGAISADMVRQAFIDATSEGGKFNGMLEAQSKTLRGAYSNLQGAIGDMFNSIGEQSEGIMAGTLSVATELVKNYEKVGKVILQLVSVYGSYKVAVMAVTAAEALLNGTYVMKIRMLRAAATAQALLNNTMLANPAVLVATGLLSVVSALVIFRSRTDEANQAQAELNEQMGKTQAEISSEKTKIDELFGKLKNAKKGTNEYKSAKDNILKQYGKYLSGLDSEIATLKNVEGAYNAVTKAARNAAMARGMEASMKGATDNYNKTYSEYYEKIRTSLTSQFGDEIAGKMMRRLQAELSRNGKISTSTIDRLLSKGISGLKGGWFYTLNANESEFTQRRKMAEEMFRPEEEKASKNTAKKRKKDLEEEKKSAQAELDSLSEVEALGKKGAALRAKINKLDERINNAYSASSSKKSAERAAKKEQQQAKKEQQQAIKDAEAEEKIQELKLQQQWEAARREKELRMSTIEAEIQSMAEGTDKTLAQLELDRDRELAAIEDYYEDLRQKRIDEAKQLWDADPGNKGKNFFDSSQYKQASSSELSLDEAENKMARINAAWAVWQRGVEDTKKTEAKAMTDYLKQFGTYQEKRKAIADDYNERIQKAQTEGERLTLQKELENETRALDEQYGLVTQSMADLFADASKKSVKSIQTVIDKYEALVRFMQGQNGTIYGSDGKAVNVGTGAVTKEYLKSLGITDAEIQKVQNGSISIKELTDRIKELKGELKEKSPYQSFVANMKEIVKQFKEAKNTDDIGTAIGNMCGQIQSFLPEVKEFGQSLANIFGVDDSQFTAVIDGLDGLMTAGQGVGQIMSGDVIGGVMSAVKGVSQMVDALEGAFGADYSSYNRLVEQYDRLIDVWDTLIDRKSEYINMSYGVEANKVGQEALDLIKKQADAYRELGKARMNAGASAGSHAIGRRLADSTSSQDWKNIAQALGWSESYAKNFIGTSRMTGLFDLTAEQIRKLQENNQVWWSKLDDDVRKYLEDIISNEEKWKAVQAQVMEQLTTTTKENVFDDFLNSLYDLANGSEEVMENIADNWQAMVNKMVINNIIAADMQKKLDGWYESLANLNKQRANGTIGDNYYKSELERLQNLYNSYVQQGSEQIEQFREMGIIKSVKDTAEEATDETKGYLDTIKSAFEELVSDSETDIEEWGKNLRNAILQNLIQSKLLDDAFEKWAEDWGNKYADLISQMSEGAISQSEFDRQLSVLMAEFDDTTGDISDKSKTMWEAFGFSAEEAAEEAKKAFEDLHGSFLSTLTDINADVEAWTRNITKTMVEQLVERNILNEAFDNQMDAWRESFESALEANDTEGLKVLRKELEDLRSSLAEQAQQYMTALGYVEDVISDTTFKDMSGDFENALMNLDGTAEDWAESVGRKMAEKIVDEMVSSTMIQPFLDELQKAFNAAMSVEGATISSVLTALTPQIEAAKQAFQQAQPVVHDILAQLGITKEEESKERELPFSDLRSTFVSSLMDMESDAEKFGKEITKTLIEQMIDAQLKQQFQEKLDELNNAWADALENGDSQAIERIRQQMVQLRESATEAVKPLLDDLKALEDVVDEELDTPLHNLRSSFLSDLMSMEDSTEDFADNINKILTEAFVDKFVLGKAFDEQLEKWEKRYAEIMEADINEADRAKQLQDLQQSIGVAREHYTEQARAIQELMGYTNAEALADQEAHVNMADKATYDQFELYLGIATAQQIALEQGNDVRRQILTTLQTMSGITSPNGDTVKEIRSMLRTTNEHLYAIKLATEGIRSEFMPRLQSIDNKLSKL